MHRNNNLKRPHVSFDPQLFLNKRPRSDSQILQQSFPRAQTPNLFTPVQQQQKFHYRPNEPLQNFVYRPHQMQMQSPSPQNQGYSYRAATPSQYPNCSNPRSSNFRPNIPFNSMPIRQNIPQTFQLPYIEVPVEDPVPMRQVQVQAEPPRIEVKPREPQKPLRLLTGNVNKVVTLWSRVTRSEPILFEVVGKIDHIRQDPNLAILKRFYMSDEGTGPQLLVTFYEIDRPLLDLQAGDYVKATGTMIGRVLQAFAVEKTSADEIAALQRVIHICDRTVADMLRQ